MMTKLVHVAAMIGALTTVASPALAQDPAAGEKVFRMCMACHAVGEGAENKIGPELNDLIGRQPGGLDGYSYSPAMTKFGEGKVWDAALLDSYLENPRKIVKGTKMAFGGLRKEEQRADIIAYLETFSN